MKFRGAPIGTVSDVRIVFSDNSQGGNKDKKIYVLVEMQIEKASFDEMRFLREVTKKNGRLCCRQEYVGITGLKFVDFDYPRPEQKITKRPDLNLKSIGIKDNNRYIDNVPSMLADMTTSVAHAIEKVNELDLKKMSNDAIGIMSELKKTLNNINKVAEKLDKNFDENQIKDLKERINTIAANLEKTTATINRAIDENHLKNLVAQLETSLDTINNFITTLNKVTAESKVPESTEALRKGVDAVVKGQRDLSNTQQELINSMLKFNQAIDSLRMLIDYIESDPGAFIRGKVRLKEEN